MKKKLKNRLPLLMSLPLTMTSCIPTVVTVTAIAEYEHLHNDKHPNIVFILADDLGYADISCMGQKKFSTPTIDSLASQGMMFTQHYSGSSVSAPSRSCLITGQHTGHTPIRGNKELPDEGQFPMPSDTYTLFDLLEENGYVTSVFGKWGLGAPNTEGAPKSMGIDEFFGYNCQRMAHNYYPHHLWHNDEKIILEGNVDYAENQYAPYLIHNEALDFIRNNKDTTFFMYYASVLPHAELKVPDNELERFIGDTLLYPEKSYAGCDDGPYYKKGGYGSQQHTHAAFASMVTLLDRQVGDICSLLDSLGIADNTLIIFTSDNGPHMEGGADPYFFDSNGELRGYKRDLYEGGIRVPFIAKWNNVIEKNSKSDHISAFWDFLPTVADILNADIPDNVDGLSLLPVLKAHENKNIHDYLYWEFHENNGRQAIRQNEWKAVRYDVANNGKIELYNLDLDLSEYNNIAEMYPEKVAELDSLMTAARTKSKWFDFK